MATIAFLGLGRMGSEMATRLRDSGHQVRVWNRTRDKTETWARAGGVLCDTPEEAATDSSEAHLMLADDTAVDDILFGNHGVLCGLEAGSLIVDHSTVSVAGVKERATRLEREGWRFLQAPLLASPMAVGQGQGLMLIAGQQDTYERSQATLREIIERQWWVGEKPEDAAAIKLMANELLVAIVEGLSEFFAIGKSTGIQPERAVKLFDSFDPAAGIRLRAPRMSHGDYKGFFALTMARKDVRLMLQAAGDEAQMPALRSIEQKMSRLIEKGYGDLDLGALAIEVIPTKVD